MQLGLTHAYSACTWAKAQRRQRRQLVHFHEDMLLIH